MHYNLIPFFQVHNDIINYNCNYSTTNVPKINLKIITKQKYAYGKYQQLRFMPDKNKLSEYLATKTFCFNCFINYLFVLLLIKFNVFSILNIMFKKSDVYILLY